MAKEEMKEKRLKSQGRPDDGGPESGTPTPPSEMCLAKSWPNGKARAGLVAQCVGCPGPLGSQSQATKPGRQQLFQCLSPPLGFLERSQKVRTEKEQRWDSGPD